METTARILIASRSQSALHALQSCFKDHAAFECSTRLISNGHADPLHGLAVTPDIVVLRIESGTAMELASWSEAGAELDTRPALVVVGPADNADSVRAVFRAGAKDYLPEPIRCAELIGTVERVRQSLQQRQRQKATGALTAFVGAAGGAGTSLIAANVAHMIATVDSHATMVVDLDLMFAPLAHYLDLRSERGLAEAIEAVGSLDEHALNGYGAKHASGLRLLGALAGSVLLSKEIAPERLATLLQLLLRNFRHVVVDTPHHVDPLSAQVYGMATTIYVVLQQSVLHVKNTVRLTKMLREEIGVPNERIRLVINRCSDNPAIEVDDIRKALDGTPVLTIPNHFKSAIESIDTGIPLYQSFPTAMVTKGLLQIRADVTGAQDVERMSLLKRALPSWMRT